MPLGYVFEIADWKRRSVLLTQQTFDNHVHRHPEFPEYVEEAKETVRDPDIVQESDTGATYLYRFGIGRPPFSRLYLKVVVFYRQRGSGQTGTVATYFFTDVLAFDARVIEYRAQWVNGRRFLPGERGDVHGG